MAGVLARRIPTPLADDIWGEPARSVWRLSEKTGNGPNPSTDSAGHDDVDRAV